MATRGHLVIKDSERNGYLVIYNHSDSYPDHLGNVLLKHFSTKERVERLVSEVTKKNDVIQFISTSGRVVKFRGTGNKPEFVANPSDYSQHYEDFTYLWDGENWSLLSGIRRDRSINESNLMDITSHAEYNTSGLSFDDSDTVHKNKGDVVVELW